MKKIDKIVLIIALITTLLTMILSLSGLIYKQIYTTRINRITEYELMGQDTISTVIAFIFLLVIIFKQYNQIKTKILWLGFLMYIFYLYSYYSFGGVSSVFYLLYILQICLSFYLFIYIIIDIARTYNFPVILSKYPRKSISIFLLISIFIVSIIEIYEIFFKTIVLQEQINPFYVFYVLDLGLVFPFIIVISILNFKQRMWGHVLSGVSLIKIATILPAIIMNDVFHRIYVGGFLDISFDIIACIITICALIFLFIYMSNTKNKSHEYEIHPDENKN